VCNIDRLNQFFRGKLLNEIDRKSVGEFKDWCAGQKCMNARSKVSGAGANRNQRTLKPTFNHADAVGLNNVHAAPKQKVEATANLQAYFETAPRAKQLREE